MEMVRMGLVRATGSGLVEICGDMWLTMLDHGGLQLAMTVHAQKMGNQSRLRMD